MLFEPPPLPKPVPVHCGDFVVPVVRNRTPLCFDFPKEIDARRLIFESVVGVVGGGRGAGGGGGVVTSPPRRGERGRNGVTAGRAAAEAGGGGESATPALSLSGRIQCYRWQ